MTFGEKLTRLRKGQGLSQEALAEALGVSRQAVSRWEQGTALPDAGKLLPCARLFQVSVDWLLDDGRGWEERETDPAKPPRRSWPWYLAGGVTAGVGALGMVVFGILSAVFPASVSESPAGWASRQRPASTMAAHRAKSQPRPWNFKKPVNPV